jgi:hypothetical protein
MYVDCPECGEKLRVEQDGRCWCPDCVRFTLTLRFPRPEPLWSARGHVPMQSRGVGGRFRRRDELER